MGLRDSVKHYTDMAPSGSFMEAIGNLYEVLRWSEIKEDVKIVLITDMLTLQQEGETDEAKVDG